MKTCISKTIAFFSLPTSLSIYGSAKASNSSITDKLNDVKTRKDLEKLINVNSISNLINKRKLSEAELSHLEKELDRLLYGEGGTICIC